MFPFRLRHGKKRKYLRHYVQVEQHGQLKRTFCMFFFVFLTVVVELGELLKQE